MLTVLVTAARVLALVLIALGLVRLLTRGFTDRPVIAVVAVVVGLVTLWRTRPPEPFG